MCLLQASPAPIIVNTDTLESVPYVSLGFCLFDASVSLFSRGEFDCVTSKTNEVAELNY